MKRTFYPACIMMIICLAIVSCGHPMQFAHPDPKNSPHSDAAVSSVNASDIPVRHKVPARKMTGPIAFNDGSSVSFSTITLSEKYTLQRECNGYYIIQNRKSGKLLSVSLSNPKMPDQLEHFISAVKDVYQAAHTENYTYGDSRTLPPCDDHLISCDRMIARALWNLGYTDQQNGGMTIGTEDIYLTSHGFRKLQDSEVPQRGDIILYERTANGAVSHTCVLTGYDKATGICSRYDCGGTRENPRFARIEPIIDPIVYQYDYQKRVRAIYRMNNISGNQKSAIALKDLSDTGELSQRWILKYSVNSTSLLCSAMSDQYYISKKREKLSITTFPEDGIMLKFQ